MIGRTRCPQRVHRGGSILLDHVVHGLLLQLPKPAASSRVARQFCQCCGDFGRCWVSVPLRRGGGRAGKLGMGTLMEGAPKLSGSDFDGWQGCFRGEATVALGRVASNSLTQSLGVVTALDAEIGFGRPTIRCAFLPLTYTAPSLRTERDPQKITSLISQ